MYWVFKAFYEYLTEKGNMPHFKAFSMINLQYEIRLWQKILDKATNDKIKSGY